MGYTVAKDKAKFLIALVCILLISVLINSKVYLANKELSYGELTNFINQYWFQGKAINCTIESEKDINDFHLLLLSYQPTPDFPQVTALAAFKRLPNNKYKYNTFIQGSPMLLVTNEDTNSEKDYGLFFGMITDNQPTKYLITVDGGKEFTDIIEKNKYFIRAYDVNKQKGFGIRPIYD